MSTKKCLKGDCISKVSNTNTTTRKKRSSSRGRRRLGEMEMSSSDEKNTGLGEMEMSSSGEKNTGLGERTRSSSSKERTRRSSSRSRRRLGEMKRSSSSREGDEKGKRKRGSSEGEEKRPPGETKTPRSAYAEKFFSDNKSTIHLLDHYGDYDYVLFQVNYNDVNQFFNYENLHNNPNIDCFFQTIFSLGLQDVEISKKYSSNVNKYGKVGVTAAEVKIFIKNAFGLSEDQHITFFTTNVGNYAKYKNRSSEFINNKIRNKFDNKLKDGYATIVMVTRLNEDDKEVGNHFIVIFKYNNQIYFFDPQKKTRKNKDGIFTSTNLRDVLNSKNGNISYFTIDNLNGHRPLINTTCPIQYIG